jgi:hypothetical protein
MKKAAVFVLLLFATLAPAAPAPDEYSINVHVTSSYRRVGAGDDTGQQMDAVIGGKKYQLSAGGNGFLLATGDYKAKLLKDDHKTSYESYQEYELLFPDKKTRKFVVTAQNE